MAFSISFTFFGGIALKTRGVSKWEHAFHSSAAGVDVIATHLTEDTRSRAVTIQNSFLADEIGILVTSSVPGCHIIKLHRDIIGIENITEQNITRVINQMIKELLKV